MSTPIWAKQQGTAIDDTIMDFLAADDIELDRQLIHYDIVASKAHVAGLRAIEILSESESLQLITQLDQLTHDLASGQFKICDEFEDGHSAIEFYLTNRLGDLGKKIHTGRSRNDQVLVATRLYLKEGLSNALKYTEKAARICLSQAERMKNTPMPGYTHLQRAVPSSVGLWFAGFAEAMIDNLITLDAAYQLIDANPLGTAAGYGVNLPLERELTTKTLEFARLQINPIYAQNSRGKFELAVLSALSQSLLDIRRFCWDLSLFTSQEFDFIRLPDEMTTGSSIMPNKRNPDLIEMMRGSYAIVQAAIVELQSLVSLPSGYHRDLQLTKAPMMRAVGNGLKNLRLFAAIVGNIDFNTDKLDAAIDTPMFATDLAIELSATGQPFRDAYRQVVERYEELETRTAQQSIESRVSPGACAALMLDALQVRLDTLCAKLPSKNNSAQYTE